MINQPDENHPDCILPSQEVPHPLSCIVIQQVLPLASIDLGISYFGQSKQLSQSRPSKPLIPHLAILLRLRLNSALRRVKG